MSLDSFFFVGGSLKVLTQMLVECFIPRKKAEKDKKVNKTCFKTKTSAGQLCSVAGVPLLFKRDPPPI